MMRFTYSYISVYRVNFKSVVTRGNEAWTLTKRNKSTIQTMKSVTNTGKRTGTDGTTD